MKHKKREELEMQNEAKEVEIPDEMLEGISGGLRRRSIRKKRKLQNDPKPNTEIDDGAGGATLTW